MGHQITSEGGVSLSPAAPAAITAESAGDLSPASPGHVLAEGGVSLSPGAPASLTSPAVQGPGFIVAFANVAFAAWAGYYREAGTYEGNPYYLRDAGGVFFRPIETDAAYSEGGGNWVLASVWPAPAAVDVEMSGTSDPPDATPPDQGGGWVGRNPYGADPQVSFTVASTPAAPSVLTAEGGANLAPAAPAAITPESSY